MRSSWQSISEALLNQCKVMNFTIDIESVAHHTRVMLAGCGSSSVLSPVYQYTLILSLVWGSGGV